MRRPSNVQYLVATVTLASLAGSVQGGVIEFLDKEKWIDAVGEFTTIDFTGFEAGEFITEQYADIGVHFTDGNDTFFNTGSFINDDWGVDGNGPINVSFDRPQAYVGVDYPGFLRIELYSDGRLIGKSGDSPGGGVGNFKGLVSSQLFDAVRLIDPFGEAEIDDLHFGIPSPAGLWVLAVAALGLPRRRRTWTKQS